MEGEGMGALWSTPTIQGEPGGLRLSLASKILEIPKIPKVLLLFLLGLSWGQRSPILFILLLVVFPPNTLVP